MRHTFGFGSYFGIPVKIHITFPLILLVFGLEAGISGGPLAALEAIALVLAVFVCVVLHELGHSLQVMRYGINVRDIVLLPIGGMARADSIPEIPRQEIIVAVSGPLVNFLLAGLILGLILLLGRPMDIERDFLASLFSINIVLGTFNLIPAFPMDGGRILRGFLAMRMPYLRATRYAKNVGQMIAILFAVIGFVNSSFIILPFIAVVIFFGAMSEERMVRLKAGLGGRNIGELVSPVSPILFLENYVMTAYETMIRGGKEVLPVTDWFRRFAGVVLKEDIEAAVAASREWDRLAGYVRTNLPFYDASTPAMEVFNSMRSEKAPYAAVMHDGYFVGLVTMEDLTRAVR